MFKDRIQTGNGVSRQYTGEGREKLKMTLTFELEKTEAGDGIMQVNFQEKEFKSASILFGYNEM